MTLDQEETTQPLTEQKIVLSIPGGMQPDGTLGISPQAACALVRLLEAVVPTKHDKIHEAPLCMQFPEMNALRTYLNRAITCAREHGADQ